MSAIDVETNSSLPDGYLLRQLTTNDVDILINIERASHSLPWSRGMFEGELRRRGGCRIGIERGGQLVAFAFAAALADTWHVMDVAVLPNQRRKGLARLLLAQLLAAGRAAGIAEHTLEVRAGNAPAIAMYAQAGFVQQGVRPRYYADNGEDGIVMTRHDDAVLDDAVLDDDVVDEVAPVGADPSGSGQLRGATESAGDIDDSTARSERPRTLLAIESSCDETAAAVVRGNEVLSSIVATQLDLHQRFGGVVPEVASRRHLEVVDAVIAEALEAAGITHPERQLDGVAVTQGPGLIGALLVGVAAAEARALAWQLPLVAVDHLLGHVASAQLGDVQLMTPFTCLLASGGHTLLLDVDESWTCRLLGTSRDDAAGEAFDKGARLLGLPMPGGPSIERAALAGDTSRVSFTPAMVHQPTLDTSFAGIKTALAVHVRDELRGGVAGVAANDVAPLAAADVADAAAALQEAIVVTLAACVRKLLEGRVPGTPRRNTLAVVGGVAANTLLRSRLEQLCLRNGVTIVTVPLRYCGDNAAMIGVAAGVQDPAQATPLCGIDAFANSPLFRTGRLLPTPGV